MKTQDDMFTRLNKEIPRAIRKMNVQLKRAEQSVQKSAWIRAYCHLDKMTDSLTQAKDDIFEKIVRDDEEEKKE